MLVILCLAIPAKNYAQTAINRTIPVQSGQTIKMHFDYPELITVSTWEGPGISIGGSVSINGGENDDAFILENTVSGNVIRVEGRINGMKNLPQRITINHNGKKVMFRDKSEFRKYQSEHGKTFNSVSYGPEIDITIEVKVPRNVATEITSVYGVVEVRNFTGPLTVDATYGAVDASLVEGSIGELTAETNFGNIYTNLDIRFSDEEVRSRDFHTTVSAKPGNGPSYSFESKYGNVYLRKAGN